MPNFGDFVLWGSAGHAKVLAEVIALKGGRVLALFDNREVPSALPDVPVFRGERSFRYWAEEQGEKVHQISGLVAIGGGRGRDRLAIQELFRKHGLVIPVVCHPMSYVSPTSHLGSGSQIFAFANISAGVMAGESCIVNHRASIDHECTIGNGVHIAPGATVCGSASIADNVFIGAGAVVLPHISIGANSVIGAGSIVTRDVPRWTTVIGSPAKPMSGNQLD